MTQKLLLAETLANVLNSDDINSGLSVADIEAALETPKDSKLGDLAFPCFRLAKALRKNPAQIASELQIKLNKMTEEEPLISEVKATGPYLNFVLSKSALAADLIPAILNQDYVKRRADKNERFMFEFAQNNTHKGFHVGHCRTAILGDSSCRLFNWLGHDVIASNYIGDEGTHVAKCLWHLKRLAEKDVPENRKGEFLGQLYTDANRELSLDSFTEAPFPGAIAAEVKSIAEHPSEDKWKVVIVTTPEGDKTVVCGGHGYKTGDMVAWVPVGISFKGKTVTPQEMKGVASEGFICSEEDLKLSKDRLKILILPENTETGKSLVEIYRIKDAVPENQTVMELIAEREEEVGKILQTLEAKEPEITALWNETKEWSMNDFIQDWKWLNCNFDHFFCESECGEAGKDIANRFLEKGVFVKDQGTIGADLKDYNLGFAILVKSNGTATYACRDLALAEKKFNDYKVDRSVYVVDVRQKLHFEQVFKCLELMGFKQADKCHHLAYDFVTLPEGAMSSRKGTFVMFSVFKQELIDRIKTDFLEKYRGEWPDSEIDQAADLIGRATVRYTMLNQDNTSVIVFDLDKQVAATGNTGPYLLYAAARIKSILRDINPASPETADFSLLTDESESELLMHLNSYHQALEKAGSEYSLLPVCTWVYNLCKKFSRMYNKCSVKNAETPALQKARAALVMATGVVLEHGLGILGIETVDRM